MNSVDKAKIPTIIVVFGATGDLMAKKIVPSLFHLYQMGKLPPRFKLVGVSRRLWKNQDFADHLSKILNRRKDIKASQKELKSFLRLSSYQQGTFEDKRMYQNVSQYLKKIDDKWGMCSNKLFYLAVPPKNYETIFKNLAESGLTEPCGPDEGWTRVIVEKPFGSDLKTAKALDELLGRLFREEQIFRIDHYLAKEMLQNILALRFSNNIFEQTFSKDFIESIELRLLETKGVEDRGNFYDGVGALRDVGQNHLLQMLSLITMDQPIKLDASAIRSKRYEVLAKLKPLSKNEIKAYSFRGQYDGYKKISGVDPKSKTETYFKLKAFLDNPRWQGVPVTLESGKEMPASIKEIVLNIKHTMPCLCPRGAEHHKNKIILRMEPTEGIDIEFWSKKPGLEWQTEQKEFKYSYRERKKSAQYTEEYEKLLFDCVVGDQTLFISTKEVRAMWKFIDPIVKTWEANAVPLIKYQPGSGNILTKADIDSVKSTGKTMTKAIGIIGLGKMGAGLAGQLINKGWKVHGLNRSPEATKKLSQEGLIGYYDLAEFIKSLPLPKVVWLMVPAGQPVDDALFGKDGLVKLLSKGDIIIDGGNSFYLDTIRRAKKITKKGISYVDAGVSGGPEGARHGACVMVGGDTKDYNYLKPLFVDLSVREGEQFFPGSGAGHFVKMIHNGIEYGMMQSLAEGFDVMRKSKYRLHLREIASVYNRGSVIESRLVLWLENAFRVFGDELKQVSGSAKASGEGKWTVQVAKKMGIPVKVIEDSLKARKLSQKKPNYQGKIISALRNQFGGHRF